MFAKTYHLCQHTMLIHFQAGYEDGENVCLRASEVKPKLDRFLTAHLRKDGEIPSKWIQSKAVNGIDIAYRYRMMLTADTVECINANDIPKIFYANMGRDTVKKNAVIFPDGVQLKIICMIPELADKIDSLIGEFFAVTNFGTMQNKGFGSFTVDGKDVDVVKALKAQYGAKSCYYIDVRQKGLQLPVQRNIFDTIRQFYSVMKSGSRTPYHRSFIYQYMHDEKNKSSKNIGNEKAKMKLEGVSPNLVTNPRVKARLEREGDEFLTQRNLKHYYVRALLGVGGQIRYKTEDNGFEIVTISHVNEKIERANSPIFFKVVENKIYIVAGRINQKLLNEEFKFYNKRQRAFVKLSVPAEFDIDDFINNYVLFYNDTYLKGDNSRNREFKSYTVSLCRGA